MKGSDYLYWTGIAAMLIVAWLVYRIIVRRDYYQHGSLSAISVTLEFLIFGLHANLPYLYLSTPWPQVPPLPHSPIQQILGLTAVAGGLLTTLAFMARLGFRTTVGSQPDQLLQTGAYRWSRNPQLMSYGVMLLGCAVLYPSWQAAGWLVLYAVIAYLMVLTEEEHLGNLFGAQYIEYCSRVPRFIPWTGKKGILTPVSKD